MNQRKESQPSKETKSIERVKQQQTRKELATKESTTS